MFGYNGKYSDVGMFLTLLFVYNATVTPSYTRLSKPLIR